MGRRSPLRVICKLDPILRRKRCRWDCAGKVAAAEFSHRGNASETAILHPSTKKKGRWQISFLQDGEPYMDVQGTCSDILRELPPSQWRLRKVESA